MKHAAATLATSWPSGAHAVLDERSRQFKAHKIERLLGERRLARCTHLLEVGTGSGIIAAHFGTRLAPHGRVTAIDVGDHRVTDRGFEFRVVDDASIPFAAESFDIVLSNHVIEHIRPAAAQLHHLEEMRRVLRPDGVVYLAVPNRWQLFEAHFRLPLLSWLPPRLRHAYVRLARRGAEYDCEPLSRRTLLDLVRRAGGLTPEDATLRALHATLDIEHPGSMLARVARRRAFGTLHALTRPLLPTHVFLLHKPPCTSL